MTKESIPAPVLAAPDLVPRLHAGEAAIIPTDTLPGLAVIPAQAQTLWRLKRRPADKPLILMGATVEDLLQEVAASCHREVEVLAQRHWPGALTLVLPAREGGVGCHLNPGGRTLGCRIPACDQARALLQISGPLATTSANRSGEPASTTAEDAARDPRSGGPLRGNRPRRRRCEPRDGRPCHRPGGQSSDSSPDRPTVERGNHLNSDLFRLEILLPQSPHSRRTAGGAFVA